MILGVMSDSHDNIPNVKRAVALFNELGVDLVVHAGDFIAPFAIDPLGDLNCHVVGVFGNNDGERIVVAKRFEAIGGEVHPNLASASLGERNIAVMHYPELAIPICQKWRFRHRCLRPHPQGRHPKRKSTIYSTLAKQAVGQQGRQRLPL